MAGELAPLTALLALGRGASLHLCPRAPPASGLYPYYAPHRTPRNSSEPPQSLTPAISARAVAYFSKSLLSDSISPRSFASSFHILSHSIGEIAGGLRHS